MTEIDRLISLLHCPSCLGEYQFDIINAEKIFQTAGVLICRSCGRSVIVLRSIPIFHTIFANSSKAFDVIIDIIQGNKKQNSFLENILGIIKIQKSTLPNFHELLEFFDNNNLTTIFDRFKTEWIYIERFSWKKFEQIPKFLTPQPIGTMLDVGCGFGCSSAHFLFDKRVGYCIGMDQSFLNLLLFQSFFHQNKIYSFDIIWFDASNLPFPFKQELFDIIMGIGFFNHFVTNMNSKQISLFFNELNRITKIGGQVYIDMVPNRLNPFLGEIGIAGIVTGKTKRLLITSILQCIPRRWLPGSLSLPLFWWLYVLFCSITKIKKYDYDTFIKYLPGPLPEINLNGLPIFPSSYRKLLANFNQVKVLPEKKFSRDFLERKWSKKDFLLSSYLTLVCKK